MPRKYSVEPSVLAPLRVNPARDERARRERPAGQLRVRLESGYADDAAPADECQPLDRRKADP